MRTMPLIIDRSFFIRSFTCTFSHSMPTIHLVVFFFFVQFLPSSVYSSSVWVFIIFIFIRISCLLSHINRFLDFVSLTITKLLKYKHSNKSTSCIKNKMKEMAVSKTKWREKRVSKGNEKKKNMKKWKEEEKIGKINKKKKQHKQQNDLI